MTEKPSRVHSVLGAPESVDRDAPDKTGQSRSMDQGMMVLSYLISGVGVYGFLGWLADHFLGTHFIIGIGIVLGAACAIFMIIKRYGGVPAATAPDRNGADDRPGDSLGHRGERRWER